MKARVSFSLDLAQICPEAISDDGLNMDAVHKVVTQHLINPARKTHKDALHAFKRDGSLDADLKVIKMTECVRAMMTTLMCQANMAVERLPNDYPISKDLPFEGGDPEPT